MSVPIKQYYSDRGFPLTYWHEEGEETFCTPILCVEVYCKWYDLYLVHSDGRAEKIGFPEMEEDAAKLGVSICHDHCPNPVVVQRFADRNLYVLCKEAQEMIDARWFLEDKGIESEELELIIKKANEQGIIREVFKKRMKIKEKKDE